MKIGIVGYQGCGKTTLFCWLTGIAPDPALAHAGQSAMATIPDPRLEALARIYHPKKITHACMELVDTPGLARNHEGNAARLGLLREADCLALVVAAFERPSAVAGPAGDLASFRDDLLLADMQIVSGRIEKLQESAKKPRPDREQLLHEAEALAGVLAALEAGCPLKPEQMSESQQRATRSFRLLGEKPMLVIFNAADDADEEHLLQAAPAGVPAIVARASLELELERLPPEERAEFERELGLTGSRRDAVLRAMLAASGYHLYFTASEKEVRSWLLRKGGTALEAAENIHTDLARGFIRAETMHCDDLLRLGSERELKAQHLVRQEPKDYVVRDCTSSSACEDPRDRK
jgi:ribosome-binding ATPase YchF (GTP1/OBG family)